MSYNIDEFMTNDDNPHEPFSQVRSRKSRYRDSKKAHDEGITSNENIVKSSSLPNKSKIEKNKENINDTEKEKTDKGTRGVSNNHTEEINHTKNTPSKKKGRMANAQQVKHQMTLRGFNGEDKMKADTHIEDDTEKIENDNIKQPVDNKRKGIQSKTPKIKKTAIESKNEDVTKDTNIENLERIDPKDLMALSSSSLTATENNNYLKHDKNVFVDNTNSGNTKAEEGNDKEKITVCSTNGNTKDVTQSKNTHGAKEPVFTDSSDILRTKSNPAQQAKVSKKVNKKAEKNQLEKPIISNKIPNNMDTATTHNEVKGQSNTDNIANQKKKVIKKKQNASTDKEIKNLKAALAGSKKQLSNSNTIVKMLIFLIFILLLMTIFYTAYPRIT